MIHDYYMNGYYHGRGAVPNQEPLFRFVTLCYLNKEDKFCEESLLLKAEALELMKEKLKKGICAWIKHEEI
tara:strand:+ start:632 stop:844 length:213 start_codon:yes stop_codon:yes gene_type:complete